MAQSTEEFPAAEDLDEDDLAMLGRNLVVDEIRTFLWLCVLLLVTVVLVWFVWLFVGPSVDDVVRTHPAPQNVATPVVHGPTA
jgi:hypothetical protein